MIRLLLAKSSPAWVLPLGQLRQRYPVHMPIRRSHFGVVVAALLLSGCSYADSVWNSLAGEDDTAQAPVSSGGGGGRVFAIPPSAAESNPQPTLTPAAPPALNNANFAAQPV